MNVKLKFRDGWSGVLRDRIPWDEETLSAKPGIVKVKESRTRFVARGEAPNPQGGSTVVYFKRYRPRNRWIAFRQFWMRSKAASEFEMGEKCLKRGISTACPLAYAEIREGVFLKKGELILEGITNARSMREVILEPIEGVSKGRTAFLLGSWTADLHRRRFVHDDLPIDHILVRSGPGKDPVFFVIDLDAGRIVRKVFAFHRIKNLSQILRSLPVGKVSDRTLLRFLVAYGRFSGASRSDIRRWGKEAMNMYRLKKAKASRYRILLERVRQFIFPFGLTR